MAEISGEGYISVAQAAQTLGVKPWAVIRLIQSRQLQAAYLVDYASVCRHQEQQR